MKAQYLLRFDDLCPTMSRAGWDRFVPLLRRFGVKPILAIVPENFDPDLEVDSPDAGFWDEMREWQSAGAAIGLHGHRHVCASPSGGLIPLHRSTEFAGVAEEQQRAWIRAGVATLRAHGLDPGIWVAPRHGFDAVTLRVLAGEGIRALSDGFAETPFAAGGVMWIPQQLWGLRAKRRGVWTVCIHANTATDDFVAELERFLEEYAGQFTFVERVLAEWPARERSFGDRVFHARMRGRICLGRWRKRLGGKS